MNPVSKWDPFDSAFLYWYVRTIVKNRRTVRWYGESGSTGSTRRFTCYVCRGIIGTESARYKHTKHAAQAIASHREMHLEELATAPPLSVGESVRLEALVHRIKAARAPRNTGTIGQTFCGLYITSPTTVLGEAPTCIQCIAEEIK